MCRLLPCKDAAAVRDFFASNRQALKNVLQIEKLAAADELQDGPRCNNELAAVLQSAKSLIEARLPQGTSNAGVRVSTTSHEVAQVSQKLQQITKAIEPTLEEGQRATLKHNVDAFKAMLRECRAADVLTPQSVALGILNAVDFDKSSAQQLALDLQLAFEDAAVEILVSRERRACLRSDASFAARVE